MAEKDVQQGIAFAIIAFFIAFGFYALYLVCRARREPSPDTTTPPDEPPGFPTNRATGARAPITIDHIITNLGGDLSPISEGNEIDSHHEGDSVDGSYPAP